MRWLARWRARKEALARILDIQARVSAARPEGMPEIDTLNAEEVARIEELIAANTWPNRWTGDAPFERVSASGELQRRS